MKAYTAEEIAQGAKSGRWAALNNKNGATFSPTGARALSASASAPASRSSSNASSVSLENVLPSEDMRTADLGPLRIEYPENWQVIMPKQRGQSVMIAPQAGVMENSMGYGVVLNGVMPPAGDRLTIDEVTRQLVQDMEQNEALRQVGEAQPITVGGIDGCSVTLQSVSPILGASGNSQTERDWLVTVPQRDGSVIFMVFVAPHSQFERFQPTYEAMLKSVQF